MSVTFDDLQGRIQTLASSLGCTEEHLIRICAVSLTQHWHAADRWVRLESEPSPSAPMWVNEQERDKIVAALANQRGAQNRLLREDLEKLFE